ncbi:hypothetical protein FBUS_01241 [Fasciolopsis buskii]|uniref:G-protein coupled receptors family 1 profile domain-containing protein n=1 Tax=Fasciolopsis buskii TaxID=27845 RepID=A0A8E0S7E1_9TREM|nr:hypothetical protein FBUS_01241 [Fasciolopsis buski]
MDKQVTILIRHVVMPLMTVIGLIANTVGVVSTYRVPIRFPAARLLIRLQFIWDALGIIVVLSYWISYQIDIPLEILKDPVFICVWSSYYVLSFPIVLSGGNMSLLAIGRYLAVVWFRTYFRKPKCYFMTFLVVMLIWTFLLITPALILGYLMAHEQQIGVIVISIYQKVHCLYLIAFSFITPSMVVCATQVHILLLIRRKKIGTGRSSASIESACREEEDSVDDNMRALSKSLILMITLFFLIRFTFYFGYALAQFGFLPLMTTIQLNSEMLLAIPINYSINPLVPLFTIAGSHKLLIENVKNLVAPILRLVPFKLRGSS